MINIADITTALQAQLTADVTVSEFLASPIVRGGLINNDAGMTPWIGIYRGAVNYEPRTLGRGLSTYEAYPSVRIIVQETSMDSGEDCENLLEGRVKSVLDAVLADPTIGGTVDMVTGFGVEYGYVETDRETLYFQSAIITISLEVAT